MNITIDPWQIACFIGSIAFLLLVMWIERQTPEERAAQEKRSKYPRYNVYVDIHCVIGTDNKVLAVERYDDECASHNKRVRLYDGGTLIKERKEV